MTKNQYKDSSTKLTSKTQSIVIDEQDIFFNNNEQLEEEISYKININAKFIKNFLNNNKEFIHFFRLMANDKFN